MYPLRGLRVNTVIKCCTFLYLGHIIANINSKFIDERMQYGLIFQISLTMGYIVDDGEILVIEASRTHPDFEGTGIHGRLRNVVYVEAVKHWPQLQLVRSSSGNIDFYNTRPTENPVILKRVGS